MKYVLNCFKGFAMALADSVPGVSGGSIAFILGFYDLFVGSLNDLIFGSFDKKKKALAFLTNLGLGWVIGMGLASVVLANLFEKYIYELSSLFLGFILFSIFQIIKEEKNNIKGHYSGVIFLILGVLVVFGITYLSSGTFSIVSINNLNLGLSLYLLLAGIIAISAMILPGISGSTLLLIFGLYVPIINGIKELIKFNFTYFPALFVFGIGVLIGIIFLSRLLKNLLDKHKSAMIYLIIGLMIGSLYSIIMGPKSVDVSNVAINFHNFKFIFFFIGIFLVYGLEKIKKVA